jgi:hypothetical protein
MRGFIPRIHMEQEGVSRVQWIIALAMKLQWVCTSRRKP